MSSIRKNIKRYAKGVRIRLKKTSYGEIWKEQSGNEEVDFYNILYKNRPLLHKNFVDFIKNRNDIKSVLEVGCGTGIYPIKFKDLFTNMKYTGIDFSLSAVEYCQKNSNFDFITGDFIKMNLQLENNLTEKEKKIQKRM